MKEIKVQYNPLNLRVFINHEPDISLLPKEYLKIIVSSLDEQIEKDAQEMRTRKKILQMD